MAQNHELKEICWKSHVQRQRLKQSFKTAVALNSLSGTGRLIKALIIEDSKKKTWIWGYPINTRTFEGGALHARGLNQGSFEGAARLFYDSKYSNSFERKHFRKRTAIPSHLSVRLVNID